MPEIYLTQSLANKQRTVYFVKELHYKPYKFV